MGRKCGRCGHPESSHFVWWPSEARDMCRRRGCLCLRFKSQSAAISRAPLKGSEPRRLELHQVEAIEVHEGWTSWPTDDPWNVLDPPSAG